MNNNKIINDAITSLKNIKKENILEEEMNNKINQTISKVEKIMSDNNMKISILGEFSSGKSTFINAILGDEILINADEPTTAINTYISYGEQNRTTIYKSDGSTKDIKLEDLEKYTKEGKVSNEIDKVEIKYDNAYLKKGVTIIDTPGANVDNDRHNKQREKAIKESSIGIFIISVKSLTSNSFIEFLNRNRDQIGKFIFVINKCDLLYDDIDIDINRNNKKDKLKEVSNYVEESIKKYTEIKNSKIFTISAYNHLNNKKTELNDLEKSFDNLINCIEEINQKEKDKLILFEILKVLNEICSTIKNILNDKNKICEYKIKAINGELKSFNEFKKNNYKKFREKINERLYTEERKLKLLILKYKKSYFNDIVDSINNLTISSFEKDAEKIVKSKIINFGANTTNKIYERLNEIGDEEFKIIENDFKKYFEELKIAYRKLGIEKIMKFKIIIKNIIISLLFFAMIFTINMTLNKFGLIQYSTYLNVHRISYILTTVVFCIGVKFSNKSIKYSIRYEKRDENEYSNGVIDVKTDKYEVKIDNTSRAAGAGVGGVVGAGIGGPIGAIVGAGVGAFVGGLFKSDNLNELKKDYIIKVKKEIDLEKDRLNIKLNKLMNDKKNKLFKEYDRYVEENIILYKELLDGIAEYNNNKFTKLNNYNIILKNYLNSFKIITTDINQQLEIVKNE